ncbi:type VI secretion system baseplate subunit TssG [Mesorhizobium atlanticum]
MLDRLSQRWFTGADAEQTSDTTFVDFVNILQHRMIALYYRAWADAHPAVQVERSVGGRVRAMLEAAMAGVGLPGTQDPELDTVRLRPGRIAGQLRSTARSA